VENTGVLTRQPVATKEEDAMSTMPCRSLLAVLMLVGLSGCIHSDGPYRGKVVELDTGNPIEGAVVAGQWYIDYMINTQRICASKETLTDKNGEFELPSAWCFSSIPFVTLHKPNVVVFKPGYLGYPPLGASPEDRKAHMADFTGREFKKENDYNTIKLGRPKTRMEREFTVSHAEGFFHDDNCLRKLPNLLKLTNEESRSLGLGERKGPLDNGGLK
jgi:hypothetical protein